MSSSLQNILVLGGIMILAGLGYFIFVQNGSSELGNTQVENLAAAETVQFLQRLHELEQMSLDGSIFSDPRFTSLTSFTQPVMPEPYGKANPFVSGN